MIDTQEIQISWEGPFKIDEILDNKISNQCEVKATDIGLYQVYGSHPLYGDGVLVYIGRTKNKNGFKSRLKNRWVIENGNDSENVEIYLGTIFSDSQVYDDEIINELIDKAEVLLINALKPAYNSSNIQSVQNDLLEERYIIHNEGNYRRLHPVLDSKYYWDAYKNYAIVNKVSKKLDVKIDEEEEYYGFELNEYFGLSNDYKIWFGVEYEVWNELKIPLLLEVYSEDEKLMNSIKKKTKYKSYKYKNSELLDFLYIDATKDFITLSDNQLQDSFEARVKDIIKLVEGK